MGKAICVFGVNGVGKSVLLEFVSNIHPDAVIVRGSTVLKEALNIASYEALEGMSAEVKKEALIKGMIDVVQNGTHPITIVDTHLVVPIRKSCELVTEDMWDDRLLDVFQGFVYVGAHPSIIAERRQIDSHRALRTLNSSSQICTEDLHLNAVRWDEVCLKMKHKKVVVNDQSILAGAMKISEFIASL